MQMASILAVINTMLTSFMLSWFQVVSSVKWLEDELELNALHNPGSRRGNGNENSAVGQRAALSAALGSRVEAAAMNTISGHFLSSHECLAFFFNSGEKNNIATQLKCIDV